MSVAKLGKKYRLGHKTSEETKRKQSIIKINNPNRCFKDTKIELKIEAVLQKRGIIYNKQVPLCKIAIVDFYLPQYRIALQCDGCYWHSCPIHFPNKNIKQVEKDIKQDNVLTFNEFNVCRFWEHEINESPENCINSLINIK